MPAQHMNKVITSSTAAYTYLLGHFRGVGTVLGRIRLAGGSHIWCGTARSVDEQSFMANNFCGRVQKFGQSRLISEP